MAISPNLNDRELAKFVESTATAGVPAIAIVNPDGSNVSGGGGTSQIQGNVASGASDSGNPVKVGARYNTSLPTVTNGQRVDLQADANGRLLTNPGALTSTTDSVAAVGNVAAGATDSGAPVKTGGIFKAAPGTVSDGQRTDMLTDEYGQQKVVVMGAPPSKITNGTNTADTIAGDTGQNALLQAGTRKEVTFTTTSAQAVASTDVSNYAWVSVHITSQGGSSTVAFQVSNDNTNWVNTALILTTSTTANASASTTTSGVMYHGPTSGRYFRLNVTGIVSGTTAGTVEFSSVSKVMQSVGGQVAQSGTWTVGSNSATGSAVPANAFFVGGSDSINLQPLRMATVADGSSSGTAHLAVGSYDWNGTNYDRHRNNIDSSALITASGATTTQTSADQTNYNGRGARVVLDMTTVGTGSVTIAIQGKDVASGKYYTILTGAAVTTNSTNVYTVFPGVTAAANASVADILPRTWRVQVTANNANATTYTVGASVIS